MKAIPMGSRLNRGLTYPALSLRTVWLFGICAMLFVAAFLFKVALNQQNAHFLGKDSKPYLFSLESAFRFRYAQMFADGKPVPKIDTKAQYPEGLDVFGKITLLAEWTAGKTYRMYRRIPGLPFIEFQKFFALFDFAVSSVSVVACFFAAYLLAESIGASVLCAALYAFAFPFVNRTISAGFLEEDFALPFIFCSLVPLLANPKGEAKQLLCGAMSGISLAVAVVSWHFAQFYFLVLLGWFFIRLMGKEATFHKGKVAMMILFAILGAALSPQKRAEGFLTSPAVFLAAGILAALWFKKAFARRLALLGTIIVFVAVLSGAKGGEHAGRYSHVYSFITTRLANMMGKPTDPKEADRISFDAKVMWGVGAFQFPTVANLRGWVIIGPLALISLAFLRRRSIGAPLDRQKEWYLLCYLWGVFLVAFLFAQRMAVFTIFFSCCLIAAGYSVIRMSHYRKPAVFFAALLALAQMGHTTYLVRRYPMRHTLSMDTVTDWVKSNTKPEDVVLADIGLSCSILAYADRPVVLHNYFESSDIREKTKECMSAFYKSEDVFYNLCRKYGAEIVIYSWDQLLPFNTNSKRYLYDAVEISTDSVAYLMNFWPSLLRNFELVYQNSYYRIFFVRPKNGLARSKRVAGEAYVPFFNPHLFHTKDPDGTLAFMTPDETEPTLRDIWQIPQRIRETDHFYLAGELGQARAQCEWIIRVDPYMSQGHYMLAKVDLSEGYRVKAIQGLQRSLALDPSFEVARVLYHKISETSRGKHQ